MPYKGGKQSKKLLKENDIVYGLLNTPSCMSQLKVKIVRSISRASIVTEIMCFCLLKIDLKDQTFNGNSKKKGNWNFEV